MNRPRFTASQIAAALGRERASVLRSLRQTPSDGTVVTCGNETRAWCVSSLPALLLKPLEEVARRERYPDVTTYLEQSAKPWEPRIPLASCHPDETEEAKKLRAALLPSIARQKLSPSAADFERDGQQDYQRFFGCGISNRQWRRLFDRTIRRAGAVGDFDRLDLYLGDRPRTKEEAPSSANPDPFRGEVFERLRLSIPMPAIPGAATRRECECAWTEALLAHDELEQESDSSKAGRLVRAALLEFAPWLSPNAEAIQKAFARKLAAWKASGGSARSLIDQRRTNGGGQFKIPQADLDTVVHLAVWRFHGHIAAAWRAAHSQGLLSSETRQRYPLSKSKSHVPHAVRDAIEPEVRIFSKLKLGRRALDDLTPHLSRSYEGIYSCQVYNADDFTLPVYFYVPNSDGWFDLTRGQCLLFICYRSLKIVGWSFQSDRNYSSLVIRSLCTKIFSELAVPRFLYFEQGIWKSSRLLTGRNHDGAMPFQETVQGLREFGVEFVHAIRPRSKTVERVGGLLQDLMEGEPGYCGRDERRDLPEHTKRAIEDVKYRRAHPSSRFMSFEQWHDRLGEIIAQYNQTPQQGKILDGLSPNEGFEKFMSKDDPPVQFGPEMRHLLSCHKEEREVKPSGIQFKVGKSTFRYFGPELGHLVGQKVIAWWDPENPDALSVSDLNRKNFISVPRMHEVSAMAALTGDEAEYQEAIKRSHAQTAYLRARYNVVKAAQPLPHRAVIADRGTIRAGEEITRLRRQQEETSRNADRARRVAADVGIQVPAARLGDESTAADLLAIRDYMNSSQ